MKNKGAPLGLSEGTKNKIARIITKIVGPHMPVICEELRQELAGLQLPHDYVFDEESCDNPINIEEKWTRVVSIERGGKLKYHIQPPTVFLFSIPIISIVKEDNKKRRKKRTTPI